MTSPLSEMEREAAVGSKTVGSFVDDHSTINTFGASMNRFALHREVDEFGITTYTSHFL